MASKKITKSDDGNDDSGKKERLGALTKAVSNIRKSLGKSSIIKASSRISGSVPRIPTGVFLLDYAMGGGVARGRVNIFWGKQSSGKTTNSCRVIAHAQNMCANCNTYLGPGVVKTRKDEEGEFYAEAECKSCNDYREFICAYADVEGTFDGPWAKKLGVDLDRLWFAQPETAEQAIDVVDTLLRTGDLDLIVIDSIAQLVPSAEVEESVAKWQQGLQARLVNKAFRKWTGALNYVGNAFGHKPTIIAINQVRFKIGVMFGSPETRPGGEGQGFASSIEVKTWPGPSEVDDESKTTLWVTQRFEVNKNKVSKAKISGEYKVVMTDQTGFKKEGDIMDEEEIVRLSFRFNLMKRLNAKGEVDPNGRTVYAFSQKFASESLVVKYMIENSAACDKLRSDLMAKMIETN